MLFLCWSLAVVPFIEQMSSFPPKCHVFQRHLCRTSSFLKMKSINFVWGSLPAKGLFCQMTTDNYAHAWNQNLHLNGKLQHKEKVYWWLEELPEWATRKVWAYFEGFFGTFRRGYRGNWKFDYSLRQSAALNMLTLAIVWGEGILSH